LLLAYFFFDDFLLLLEDFFDEEPLEDDFFDAAILLTTFHAVRDLPVAPTWQKTPACAGKLWVRRMGEGTGDTE
jgi:hypothetical protein